MNDRFSAQLRQHLLETADERPADGQLAAVVDAVATTRQRLPLVARLTWNPGRIGPLPSAAVRFGLVAASLALAMATGAMLAGGTNPTTVFDGTWTSTDPGDGSAQILVVGSGNTPAVYFEDGYATGAACVYDAVKRFTARGLGEISGNRLDVSFPDGGGCGSMLVDVPLGHFDSDAATDTLLDGQGLTWSRVQRGLQPATQVPATRVPTAVPSPAFATPVFPTAVPECIQFTEGGTYRASVGTLSLTVTVPAGPVDTYWHGLRDQFYLLRAPCLFGGPVWLQATLVEQVYADACHPVGKGVKIDSPAAAIAALAAQDGVNVVGPTDVTLDGYAGARFDISIPAGLNSNACTDGTIQLFDGVSNMDPDQTSTVYIVDVDGVALGLQVYWYENGDAALPAEVDAIVASLQIEP